MRKPIKNAFRALVKNPRHIIFAIFRRIPWIIKDDEKYLKVYCRLSGLKNMDFDNPKTFNEKLQWLKLHNRRSEYIQMVDKVAVKDYVASIIGEEYIIPTIAVWDNPNDIEWDKLPNQFVLKTNHDGGCNGVVVCKDKASLNKRKAIRELKHSFNRSSYLIGREWPYKMVEHKVFAEQYMEDTTYHELRDYKFYCFDGDVKVMLIAAGRGSGKTEMNYYDSDFNLLDLNQGHPHISGEVAKPETFDEMKRIASVLSKGIPEIRVDLYEVNGKAYFGELTFFDSGGTGTFYPNKWDKIFGDWITLPNLDEK